MLIYVTDTTLKAMCLYCARVFVGRFESFVSTSRFQYIYLNIIGAKQLSRNTDYVTGWKTQELRLDSRNVQDVQTG